MIDTEDRLTAQVADELAIRRALYLCSRGLDRCDLETLRSAWWPDAVSDYGMGAANAHEWAQAVIGALGTMHRTQHFLGNMIVDIDGATASVETYVRAYHEVDGPDGRVEMDVGGRYLDRLERRDGEWRIAERRYVHDWNRNVPSTAQWDGDLYGSLKRVGTRKPQDPLYTGA